MIARTLAGLALGLLLACLSSPAGATTVGGFSTSAGGSFALQFDRLLLPTYGTVNQGDAAPDPLTAPTVANTGLESFAPSDREWRTVTLDSEPVFTGAGLPALATADQGVAVAWMDGNGLETGMLGPAFRSVQGKATTAVSGVVPSFDLALVSDGPLGLAWADGAGVHLRISDAGAPGVLLSLSSDVADRVTVVADEHAGAFYVLWRSPAGLFVRSVSLDGSAVRPAFNLAPRSAAVERRDHFLGPQGARAWEAAGDSHGGLWVALPRQLVRLSPAEAVSIPVRSSRLLMLANTPSSGAVLAQQAARGAIVVRRLGTKVGPAARIRRAGFLIDVAGDDPGVAQVLSGGSGKRVLVTRVGGRHAGRSFSIKQCLRRQTGQLETADGLVAVACAGRNTDRENVDTGGDEVSGRDDHYLLVRRGRVLRQQTEFEGSDSF